MANRDDVDRLLSANRRLVEMARNDLAGFFASLDMSDPEAVRDALLEIVPALVREYGDTAATVTAEWYDRLREDTGLPVWRASPQPSAPEEKVKGTVRYAVGPLFENNPQETLRTLNAALQRYIQYSSRETVTRNAAVDPGKPRFARVPSGSETCVFCDLLASRGFTYYSEMSAGARGSGNEYHDDCECEVVPSWSAQPEHITGYNLDVLKGRYEAARSELEADGIKVTLDTLKARFKDMYPRLYTDSGDLFVPSILREKEQLWPVAEIAPVTRERWKHIIKRHNGETGTADRFTGMSPYEIAKAIRATVRNPTARVPWHSNPEVENYYRVVDGRLVVVGVMEKNGRKVLRTAFPPNQESPIMKEWEQWLRRR